MMKKVFGIAVVVKIALVALFMITGWSASAQQIKMGFIDSQELISLMPEYDSAQVKMETFSKEKQEMYEYLNNEYTTKLRQYEQDTAMSSAMKSQKERELQDLVSQLQNFPQEFQTEVQEVQASLMRPIVEKAQAAVDKVAAANNFTIVYDLSVGAVVYHDASSMTDLLPLVKTELGIK